MNKKFLIISSVIALILVTMVFASTITVETNNPNFKNDPYFYKTLGNTLAEQGNFEKAIVAYETSLLLAEDNNIRNNLAVLYHNTGAYEGAIKHLRILIESDDDNLEYNYDLAINLVDKFRKSDNKDIVSLEEALSIYVWIEANSPGYEHAKENIEVLNRVFNEFDLR